MSHQRRAAMAGAALVLASLQLTHAAPITMHMGGQITYSSNPALTGIQVGESWNLTYVFDSQAEDQYPEPDSGHYALTSASFTLDGQPLGVDQTPYEVFVTDGIYGADTYGVTVFFAPLGGISTNWPALHIRLEDLGQSVFSDDTLPLSPVPLSEFESIHFDIQDMLNGGDMARATLTCWTPEPASFVLLALGAAMLLRRQR